MKKQKRVTTQGKTIADVLKGAGFTEVTDAGFGALILTFGGGDESTPADDVLCDLGDIDNDEWDLRPVNFDPRTGKRLTLGSPAAATAMERFDIQEDKHYCVWCGIRISRHYSPISQWIPCAELLQYNTVAARKKVAR